MAPSSTSPVKGSRREFRGGSKGRDVEFLPRYAVIQSTFDPVWLKYFGSGAREVAENAGGDWWWL